MARRNISGADGGTDGEVTRALAAPRHRAVMGAVLAGMVAAVSLAAAAQARADEVLTFRKRATGRCLDSNGGGELYTLACNGGNFQKWRLVLNPQSYREFQIINVSTGRCLAGNYFNATSGPSRAAVRARIGTTRTEMLAG